MSHRFDKNNCISDSESDEEYLHSSSEECGSQSSVSSEVLCISKNYSGTISGPGSDKKVHNNKRHEELSISEIHSDVSVITNSTTDNTSSNTSLSNKHKTSTVQTPQQDCNDNHLCDDSFQTSRQSVVQNSINCSVNDVLVVNSSTSFESNNTIDCSGIESCSPIQEPLSSSTDNVIVEETSESDGSVECMNTFEILPLNSRCKENQSKKNSDVSLTEASMQSTGSFKNISNASTQSSNSLLQSDISNVSQSSMFKPDEHKLLEQQLIDKRTAYQNILRAVKLCDPRRLKDGGKLLQEKLANCKREVDDLKEKLRSMGPVPKEKHSVDTNILFSTTDQVVDNLGKKGLETHSVQQALTFDSLVTLHNSIETCPGPDAQEQDPKGLVVALMPHQKYALAWLLWREKQIPGSGILADDMGLGKTLTMIALILRSQELCKIEKSTEPVVVDNVRMYHGNTLVICPSSLLGQWQGQIKQHCKSHILTSLIHHGKPRELQAKKLAAYDLVITSYGVVVEENKFVKGNQKGALHRVKWHRIILDEGHVIRNHKTKTAQSVCDLEGKHRWCLTGTPVHNKELDMYSLLKFLQCSPFDNLTVWKRWVDNKSLNGTKRLNTILKSLLLRRTKADLQLSGGLKELPQKIVDRCTLELDEEEKTVYHTVLHFSKNLLAQYLSQLKPGSDHLRNDEWHKKLLDSTKEIKTTEIFVLLLRLRQICCFPGLIHAMLEKDSCIEDGIDVEDDPILQDLTKQIKRMSVMETSKKHEEDDKRHKILIDSNPVFEINRPSTKVKAVVGIIKEALEEGDKVVVVSQWANFLRKLKIHILPLKIGLVVLDGSVPPKSRSKIIDDFNDPGSNSKVMLLSLTAGGVGLNLVGGNRLIIVEPHWNPQLESQACDRIYRVGQKKTVKIYKLICKNTIEEKIETLQEKKLMLANTVLKGEVEMNRHKLTLADIKILFDFENEPRRIPNF